MKRKSMAIMMAAALCASMLLAGCGAEQAASQAETDAVQEETAESEEEASGEAQMWDGYYKEDSTGLLSFVHFNEDGTYYAKYFDGGVMEAGTWKLLEEEMEYFADGGADEDFNTEEDNAKATAAQVVELTSYADGKAVKIAYENDQLCDMSLGGMANHRTMTHDAEYAYNPDTDETAIELFVFYADNNIGSNFILSHNRTFVDVTGDAFLDGSWEMKEAGVYALTYADGSEAALTVAQDGKSAVLSKADGDEVELKDTYEETGDLSDAVVLSLTAEDAQVGLPMGVNLRVDIYSDDTCKLIVEVEQVDAELEADQGTCSLDTSNYKYTFHFEKAGELVSEPDYANATPEGMGMTLSYKADTEVEFSGNLTPLSIDAVLEGEVTAE